MAEETDTIETTEEVRPSVFDRMRRKIDALEALDIDFSKLESPWTNDPDAIGLSGARIYGFATEEEAQAVAEQFAEAIGGATVSHLKERDWFDVDFVSFHYAKKSASKRTVEECAGCPHTIVLKEVAE